ncbi:MAG: NHL repeat-containing protein [Acidobacteriota bacterium]|jgi:sugar lactone lactonase YvrE
MTMRFEPAGTIGDGEGATGFREALRGLAVDREDRLLAVGDSEVRVFDPGGGAPRSWATETPGHAVATDSAGRVWIGEMEQVEIFGPEGRRLDAWRDPGQLGLVTAIGFAGDEVYLADASARCIHRYAADGRFLNEIGDRHRKGGFHIPNGVVDFAIDDAGILHVANPGMHRVERFRPDGDLLDHFGRFDGQDPAGFPGCCNPTNLTLDRAGRVIVTEKAGPRAKVYSPEGGLLSVLDDPGYDPAAKNMDCALDSTGRLYVADTARLQIFVFQAVAGERAG